MSLSLRIGRALVALVLLVGCSSSETTVPADAAVSVPGSDGATPTDDAAIDADRATGDDGGPSGDGGLSDSGATIPGPGVANGSFTFSNTSTNATTTPVLVGGTVRYDAPSNSTIISMSSGADQRVVGLKLGPLTAGATFQMTGGNYVAYSEPTSKIYNSLLPSPSGTVTIDTMTGKTFTFTIHDVAMAAAAASFGNVNGTGTFTIKGTGSGTLP